MKENRLYYNYKGVYCQRIIRALETEPLTLNQIMNRLRNQTKGEGGLRYSRNPTKGKVKQILTKYPIFKSLGTTNGSSGLGHSMPVNLWTLSEVDR